RQHQLPDVWRKRPLFCRSRREHEHDGRGEKLEQASGVQETTSPGMPHCRKTDRPHRAAAGRLVAEAHLAVKTPAVGRKERWRAGVTPYPTKALSTTNPAGLLFEPSVRPASSTIAFTSFSISIEPQIMTRSASGLNGSTPRSANSVPSSISVVMRPRRENSS